MEYKYNAEKREEFHILQRFTCVNFPRRTPIFPFLALVMKTTQSHQNRMSRHAQLFFLQFLDLASLFPALSTEHSACMTDETMVSILVSCLIYRGMDGWRDEGEGTNLINSCWMASPPGCEVLEKTMYSSLE